jgi:hypothetical protein
MARRRPHAAVFAAAIAGIALMTAPAPAAQLTIDLEGSEAVLSREHVMLALDDPSSIEWRLTGDASQAAASFEVRFDDRTPFAELAVRADAGDACALGPLRLDADPGDYDYVVSLFDASDQVLAAAVGTVKVEERSRLPGSLFVLTGLVLLVFLIFAYVGEPLTRSYENEAH